MNSPHPVEPWHRKDATAILRALGTSPESGLGSHDARVKLEEIGANEIERQRGHGLLRLFAHQFRDVMIALLIGAAGYWGTRSVVQRSPMHLLRNG